MEANLRQNISKSSAKSTRLNISPALKRPGWKIRRLVEESFKKI